MICKFNLNKMYNKNVLYLEDERNNKYKVVNYDNYIKIYDYKKRCLHDLQELYDMGINYLRTQV